MQRMENMLRDGISPRIAGVKYRWIDGFSTGAVLVVRVLRSWSGPHMVTFQQLSRFFSRGASGKYLLDVGQLRDAFLHGGNIRGRAQAFRRERFSEILAGETAVTLQSREFLIVAHAIPHVSIEIDNLIDIRVAATVSELMEPFYSDHARGAFNIDGYLSTFSVGRDQALGYAQLFRGGILETVDSGLIGAHDKRVILPSLTFAKHLFAWIDRTGKLYRALEVPPPISINFTLHGVRNCTLGISDQLTFYRGITTTAFGRETITLPELTLDDLEDVDAVKRARPLLDALWQGAGLDRCLDYDDTGAWKPHR